MTIGMHMTTVLVQIKVGLTFTIDPWVDNT